MSNFFKQLIKKKNPKMMNKKTSLGSWACTYKPAYEKKMRARSIHYLSQNKFKLFIDQTRMSHSAFVGH